MVSSTIIFALRYCFFSISFVHLPELTEKRQIVEITNVGETADKGLNDEKGRMLKLALTDGTEMIFGIELVPILDLSVHTYPGVKVDLQRSFVLAEEWLRSSLHQAVLHGNIRVRRRLLLLRPENITVVGGLVEELWTMQEEKVANAMKNRFGLLCSLTIVDDACTSRRKAFTTASLLDEEVEEPAKLAAAVSVCKSFREAVAALPSSSIWPIAAKDTVSRNTTRDQVWARFSALLRSVLRASSCCLRRHGAHLSRLRRNQREEA